MGLIISLIVLSFLIFFHELGHFLAARFFGVKVEVFSIGFGKKLYKKVYKGTEYCLSAIPLGGYVQMKGQDDFDPLKRSNDPDSYNAKSPWKRIIILFAGPLANFVIAFLLYFIIGGIGVTKFAPIIGEVMENSPAYKAGLMKNDEIIEINSNKIMTWDDLSVAISKSSGKLRVKIKRDGKIKSIQLTPEIKELKNIFRESEKRRVIGISPSGDTIVIKYSLAQAISYAYEETINAGTLIIKSLQKLVEGVIPAKELGGVISIVDITAKASSVGITALLGLAALISVNLGVLNLLPIPALDGGHIMFNLYEMITKKAPSEKVLYNLTLGGWIFLLSLMAFTIYNDIVRLAS